MFLEITSAEYIKDYKIKLVFSDKKVQLIFNPSWNRQEIP
jgi:hypothetical protein